MDRTEEGPFAPDFIKVWKERYKRLEIIKQNRCNTWSNALYC